jgi:hypothetical protein
MKKNFISVLLSLFSIFGFAQNSNLEIHRGYIDQMVDYKLNPLMTKIIAIRCEEISQMTGGTLITDTNEITELYGIMEDSKNFTLDTLYTRNGSIDPRNRIDYLFKGAVVKSICIEQELIEKDGNIYRYNKRVEDYLLSHKLIIKIIGDTLKTSN